MYDLEVRCGISRAVAEIIIQDLIGDIPGYIPRGAEMYSVAAQIQLWRIWRPWLEKNLGFKNRKWYE